MANRPRIIVSGMIAADPHQGGATWAVLQYVLGFRQLGCETYLIEPVSLRSCGGVDSPLAMTESADYFRTVVRDYQLEESAALLKEATGETVGLSYDSLCRIATRADLLINISGMLCDERILAHIPIRAYLDLDPAFVQCWHAQGIDMRLDRHTHFVTVGQNLGQPECPVPTCGKTWMTTLPPVVLNNWPCGQQCVPNVCTTVANWRGYGTVENDGTFYGQKAHSLRRFFELPTLTDVEFQLALSIHPEERADLAALHQFGWRLIDPHAAAGSPQRYQEFLQHSWAEFGIAKDGYVASGSGWFSDRSCCYLASGRPVLAQETGFSQALPTGKGLLSFANMDQILDHLDHLKSDYSRHSRAARKIAREFFDSDRVLTNLLARLGAPL